MPLSKRINNLHINNSLLMDRNSPPQTVPHPEWNSVPQQYYNVPVLPPTPPLEVNNYMQAPEYTPDLNERQNPYYYNINKLLFEMYVERSQRNGNL